VALSIPFIITLCISR